MDALKSKYNGSLIYIYDSKKQSIILIVPMQSILLVFEIQNIESSNIAT